MTTALFLLRCVQIGLSLNDLDLLDIGMVLDMFVENSNDYYRPQDDPDYVKNATAEDVARF